MNTGSSVGRHLGAVLCVLAAGISLSLSPGGAQLSGEGDGNQAGERLPNIVLILADDLGRGDVRAYNPDSEIPTPHMNRLAAEGMRFTNAHSSASVCTPSRYGLLTGRYSWRTRLKQGVLWPPATPLIGPDRETLGTVLQGAGYRTAVVGKWHLGLDWRMESDDKINFDRPIRDGPNDHGFDQSFILPGSSDMSPYVFVEDGKAVAPPTREVSDTLFGQAGPALPDLQPKDILPRLTRRARETIRGHARKQADSPLFLYFPLTAPHKPVAPADPYRGQTTLGAYGDFVYQVDAAVGKIVRALKEQGMFQNTLLIVTSDNGTSPNAAEDALEKGHDPNGPFRGLKATIWEGGHRIPLIATWPGRIPAGTQNHEQISLNDLMATFAALTDQTLTPSAGVDSRNILPALLGGSSDRPDGHAIVARSGGGCLAILKDTMKLADCPGSGSGWAGSPTTGEAREQGLPPVQLYNLKEDTAETNNVQGRYPEKKRQLRQLLKRYIERGRSTPGPDRSNWKGKTRWEQLGW